MRAWQRRAAAFAGILAVSLTAVGELSIANAASDSASPANAASGEELFLNRCVTCHIPDGGGQGPSLTGIYGRKAGSLSGFAYSAAVRASGLTWAGPELDRFLANPTKALPGTAMPIMVPDARERADLIAYFAAKQVP